MVCIMSATEINHAIKEIEDAFSAVTLGNGISLREANVIDAYGSDDERVDARKNDEHLNWQRIPDEDIENLPQVLCFMDDEGLQFHLPAYMRFTLRRYGKSASMSVDSVLYRLCDPDCTERLMGFLTKPQIEAIKKFLNTCLKIGDDWLDVSKVPLALRQWQGDGAAAEELRSLKTATPEQTADYLGLAPDLRKRFLGGKLSMVEAWRLQQQSPIGLWSKVWVLAFCVTLLTAFATFMYFRLRGDN